MKGNIIPETEWEKMRRGKFTASDCVVFFTELTGKDILKGEKLPKGARTYVKEKVSELLTGTVRSLDLFQLDWGNQYEPEAIEELKKLYPEIEYFGDNNKKFFSLGDFSGGSPDAVSGNIVMEIKCPENPVNHIELLEINSEQALKAFNKKYWCQLQMNMICVAKERSMKFKDMRGVFASYCAIMLHDHLKLKTIDVMPDLNFESDLMEHLEVAENYMSDIIKKLINKNKAKKIQPTEDQKQSAQDKIKALNELKAKVGI